MAMKDAFDVITDVRSLINVAEITDVIDGEIYPNVRPNNSIKTDIVVGCTTISNTQMQIGYGNINAYVPTIQVQDGRGGAQMSPDYKKMAELSKALSPLVDAQYRVSFNTEVQESGNIYQDTDGSWYVNIRFKYRSLQDNYQNI